MERLWQLLIVGCACYILFHPGVFGAKFIGAPGQCEKADFVPGHNLAGEGVNIVTMERKGAYVVDVEEWRRANGSCVLVKNRFMSGAVQKLPASMVDWRTSTGFRMSFSSKKYESSEALVKDSTSSVKNNWKIGLSIPLTASVSFGGTHSRESSFSMAKSKEDKYSFTIHQGHYNLYRYRLDTSLTLHKTFSKDVGALPKTYSQETKSAYMELIDKYGTHYITNAFLGGKLKDITAIKICKAAMKGLTDTAVQDCLDVQASATYKKTVTLSAEAQHCQALRKKIGKSQSFSSMFNERIFEVVGGNIEGGDLLFSENRQAFQNWRESLKTLPNLVSYGARPLFFLLKKGDPSRMGLKKAIGEYIQKNALVTKCSGSCGMGWSSKRDPCSCGCKASGRITASCCPTKPGLATLRVYQLYARKLYGDRWTQTDGSVLVTYGSKRERTIVISNDDNPNWPETFRFGPIEINVFTKLSFTVYDEDSRWNSDLLGSCEFELKEGKHQDTCMFQYGTFYFSYMVTCGPSLGGNTCSDYVASPMNASQAKTFHSRNGFLAGERWESLLAGNHSEGIGRGYRHEHGSGQ